MESIKSYFLKKSKKKGKGKKEEVNIYSVNPINIKIIKKGNIDPKDINISYNAKENKNIGLDKNGVILVDI
jgi:hypothetical protein